MDAKRMAGIKRTTIYLPVSLHDDLRQLAFKRRCSMAYLLCVAAEAHFATELEQVRTDPFRAERLENVGKGRLLRERRRLEARLAELSVCAQNPLKRLGADRIEKPAP